ncbi:hypothetical protein ACF0H5_018428 [Mactra antiquata]
MEIKTSTVIAVLASCMVLVQSFALPTQGSEGELSADKRPKYMDTRRELSEFKDLLLFALDELIEEGKVNENILIDPEAAENKGETKHKRGRRLGLCLQISPSGGYIARACWKGDGR